MKQFLLIPLLFLILICSAMGQGNLSFSIKGKVLNGEGVGIGAYIQIHELGKGTMADLDGNFLIPGLRPGNYHLHFTHMGFKSETKSVVISQSDMEIEVSLEESSFTLQSLTIEANPFKNGPIEQSQTIDVVDREFFERNNSGTFANSLEKLPGISTINTGVGISKPVIRGMSFNRIMINDRGIKQEGQQWGADHGLEIDPFDVDRVEVIKGPASLIYGSDGMAGVINISPGSLPEPGNIRGHVISNYRSNNRMLGNTAMVEGNQNDFVFKARFTAQDFQDYKIPADQFIYAGYVLPVYDNRLKNTAGRERHFSLMGGVRKDWGKSTLTVSQFNQKAGIFTGAVGIPTAYDLRHNGDNSNIEFPRQDNTHLKVISNTNILLNKNWLEIDLGYQQNRRLEESLPHAHGVGPTPEGNLALGLHLDTYTANVRYNKHINSKHQTILGFQTQYMTNRHTGFEFLLPNFETWQGGFYYFHEYKWKENFILNAGIRADGARHDIREHLQPVYSSLEPTGEMDQRNPDIERNFFNASGSTGLSWVLNSQSNIKINLGTSYRIPTAIELSTNGVHHGNFRHEKGNPELDSERSYQADLNYTFTRKNFLFALSPFFSYYNDYIYLSPTGRFSTLPGASTLWEYRQNNAVFAGGEIKSEISLFRDFTFSVAGEYVYNHNLDIGLPLPLTPPLSFLFGAEYRLNKLAGLFNDFYVFVESRHTADQNRVDRNERFTDGYNLLEAGLGWNTNIRNQQVKFQVSGQNLTNVNYFNHLSRYRLLNLPEQGRNISLSLKIPFSIQ